MKSLTHPRDSEHWSLVQTKDILSKNRPSAKQEFFEDVMYKS